MEANQEPKTPWCVEYVSKARKQAEKLPLNIRDIFYILKHELEQEGPEQTEWRNYSLIVNAKDVHHCHLNNNHPRYVAVWKVVSREKQIIEIRFVGSHGSVNYSRFK
jgi:mRNA-degrading endonuclease YafQ of YafQ-DinJ toxin-antitoxin module